MPTYAIGDVQGCFATLERLLGRIGFQPRRDRLWFVGDLVNRGPRSGDVLRWVRRHERAVTVVLGNHDLHLLACSSGMTSTRKDDTLTKLLGADDHRTLVRWLRRRPILHREGQFLMVHAGLLPGWTAKRAQIEARRVEAALRGEDWPLHLKRWRRATPPWSKSLPMKDRLSAAVGAFTRLRLVDADGNANLSFKGPPEYAPPGLMPWFTYPGRRASEHTVVFGHWAALGLHVTSKVIGIDTGCVWGGALTAVRLEDRAVFSVRRVRARDR